MGVRDKLETFAQLLQLPQLSFDLAFLVFQAGLRSSEQRRHLPADWFSDLSQEFPDHFATETGRVQLLDLYDFVNVVGLEYALPRASP